MMEEDEVSYRTKPAVAGIRDYYAAAVLSGLCGRESLQTGGYANKVKLADFCFEMADAMLERREVKIERKI